MGGEQARLLGQIHDELTPYTVDALRTGLQASKVVIRGRATGDDGVIQINQEPDWSWEAGMPEISRFLGIIISMYWEAGDPHAVSHFHVRYGEFRAAYGIDPIVQLAGALPIRQQRLVEAWAELYQEQLEENWRLVEQGKKPFKIQSLA